MNHEPKLLNINQAAAASGLSPSVLRIWELRYGWPNPKRKPNGYRVFSEHLVEDLKHAATMVKRGYSASALIEDGFYVGKRITAVAKQQVSIAEALSVLPAPKSATAVAWRANLFEVLDRGEVPAVMRLVQSAFEVPRDERDAACLLPVLGWLAHLRSRAIKLEQEREIMLAVHAQVGNRDALLRLLAIVEGALKHSPAIHEPVARREKTPAAAHPIVGDGFVEIADRGQDDVPIEDIPPVAAADTSRGTVIVVPEDGEVGDALTRARDDGKVVLLAIPFPRAAPIARHELLFVIRYDPRVVTRERAIEGWLAAREAADPDLLPAGVTAA